VRLLVVDVEVQGLDLCLRAIADGHAVRWYRPTKHPVGKGFAGLTIVEDWRDSMDWAKQGLVVMTGNAKWLREMDRYRAFGWNIMGPTEQSAALEIDRERGMKMFEAAGIDLPHYECFDSLKDAEAFQRKNDACYVFKPLGSADDKSLTHIGRSPAEMVGWLQRQQARGMKVVGRCMMQEKIDMFAEFGAASWMGPEGFLPGRVNVCFEHKKLLNDDLGPATGEEGTVVQYVKKDRISDELLLPLEPILRTLGHRGDFAVGAGIDQKGKVWPFEVTARAGWPCFFIQTASHKSDVCEWMLDLCKGDDSLKVDRRVAIGVVASQPPYPRYDGDADNVVGNPIEGIDDVWDDAHPAMMMRGRGPIMEGDAIKEAPCCQTAGEMVLIMTGLGATVSKARERVYGNLKQVSWPDMQYRTDIGAGLKDKLPKLREWGYATEMAYDEEG